MSWFKFLPFYLTIIFILIYTLYFHHQNSTLKADPFSSKNYFLSQLTQALSNSQIKINNLIIRDYQNQAEFNTQDNTKIILSTQKDPHWQIASLQEVLNHGRINNNPIIFIDLSLQHPYATLQNN